MRQRVLVIEDDVDLATTLEFQLRQEGFDVALALTGDAGLALAEEGPLPRAIVLDVMLPDISGIEICRRLRRHDRTRDVPILMCTAKGSEVDRIVGFEIGADDYLVKPYSLRELSIRIRKCFPRGRPVSVPQQLGVLSVDLEARRVLVAAAHVDLRPREFALLCYFLARPEHVVTRDELLEALWGNVTTVSRNVDTHINGLRRKLGVAGSYIETIRHVGYRFSVRQAETSAAATQID